MAAAQPAITASATQTEGQESAPPEPQRSESDQQETQTNEPEGQATEAALRAENEQLLSLARKQDGMLAGLQRDLEVCLPALPACLKAFPLCFAPAFQASQQTAEG